MRNAIVCACALLLVGAAQADVLVTEIWAGGLEGTENTSDWFELTNYGTTDVDGSGWYYDDDSADPTKNDPIVGLGTIAPGESVIVLTSWEDDFASAGVALTAFDTAWNAASNLDDVQIAYVDGGSGLGSGGDAPFVFDGNTAGASVVASQAYTTGTQRESFVAQPDGSWPSDTFAQVGVWGAYESAVPASDEVAAPAVGSPGVVPEPATLGLLLIGAGLLARRR